MSIGSLPENKVDEFHNLNETELLEVKEPATNIYIFLLAYAEKYTDAHGYTTIVEESFEEAFTIHFGLDFSIDEMLETIWSGVFPNLTAAVYLVEEDSRTHIVAYTIDEINVPFPQLQKCREDLDLISNCNQ